MQFSDHKRGFTLIELVVVIGIISVLSGLVLHIQGGMEERRRIAQAKGELALLTVALESYRMHYGDYPQITVEQANGFGPLLYGSLLGELGPDGSPLMVTPRQLFLDGSKVSIWDIEKGMEVNPRIVMAEGRLISGDPEWRQRRLVDPWGNPYVYRYGNDAGGWESVGYVLLSLGPSGGVALDRGEEEEGMIPRSGVITKGYFEQGETYDNLIAD